MFATRTVIALVLISSASWSADVSYNRDVRPILSNHCFTCHGPDSATREAGLRLDSFDTATATSETGTQVIVPGAPDKSEFIRRVTSTDSDHRMPPANGPKKLTRAQVDILKRWIAEGAEYEAHWSFVPIHRPTIPATKNESRIRNPIDSFIQRRLEQQGLTPSQPATRTALIRRVAFDLTGLPPTIAQIDEFEADTRPGAYERMIDRFLAMPEYGEHMARHWMDLARYADTNGYQYDTERQQWVWRDWVIHAYNQNMPFNRFTVQQLAGDLLPNAKPQHRLATAFNRNHGITIEGGIIDEEYRTEYVMDRVVTTSQIWLGLTVGCARCHDHKYDPLTQQEFYQLYAFFNQVPEGGRGFNPMEKIPSPLAAEQQRALRKRLAQLNEELSAPFDPSPALEQWAETLKSDSLQGWNILRPQKFTSSGGSTLTLQDDNSILVSGSNPSKDVYHISAQSSAQQITAVRLEALTHPSLPGGGPGRFSNSNFVLSEFELTAVSLTDSQQSVDVRFSKAEAEYSQNNYSIANAIDNKVEGSNGWAVDGPTRKLPVSAMFVATRPFGFPGGTLLKFRMRHEAGFGGHGVGQPRLSVTTDAADQLSLKSIPADIRRIARQAKEARTEEEAEKLKTYFLRNHHPQQSLKAQIASIESELATSFPATMIMQDRPNLRKTFVLRRGQYNEPTVEVSAGVPQILPPLRRAEAYNRLNFAQWLTRPDHPLTARVAVNRYWQRLFGVGLVKTSEDFGIQGELPSHPELLDWLADEFVRTNWDVKQMQKLIMTSAAYRRSSHAGRNSFESDPENRFLARGPRMRLDAEEIRDGALSVSGLLANKIGGPSVYPYQPEGLWIELNNRPGYSKAYPKGSGRDLYRRSFYTFWKRTVPSPMMKTLDAPEREFCTIRRSRTNTPLQALLLMNAPQFVEASRHLGARMLAQADTRTAQIEFGFRLVTSRRPSPSETGVLLDAYQQELDRLAAEPAAVDTILGVGASDQPSGQDRVSQAAMASIARILLNLNEAVTKG